MKIQAVLFIAILGVLSISNAFSQSKTEKFKVYGNCGMCETTIEKAAKSVDGVSSAEWDIAKDEITVVYDVSLTNVDAIHKAIAEAGYKTEKEKADTKAYNALPACCR